jgi:hypothetical protein
MIMTHLLIYCIGAPLPPVSSGFMTGAYVFLFLTLLMLGIAVFVISIFDKYIHPAFMAVPLLLGLICIGIAFVCAIFGL